jgi:hypothetical protein
MIIFLKTFTTFILIYGLIVSIDYVSTANINNHVKALCIGLGFSIYVALMYELFKF